MDCFSLEVEGSCLRGLRAGEGSHGRSVGRRQGNDAGKLRGKVSSSVPGHLRNIMGRKKEGSAGGCQRTQGKTSEKFFGLTGRMRSAVDGRQTCFACRRGSGRRRISEGTIRERLPTKEYSGRRPTFGAFLRGEAASLPCSEESCGRGRQICRDMGKKKAPQHMFAGP